MQKIVNFIERNSFIIRLSFYLVIINFVWIVFVIKLFSGSNFSDSIYNYSLWIPSIIFVLYIIIKKFNSSEFLLFPVLKFGCFYLMFNALFATFFFFNGNAILNRQKYDNLDEFIIENYDDEESDKITLIEKFYKKIFKKNS